MKIMPNRMDRGFYKYQKEFEQKALDVLRSGWYVLGKEVSSFEKEFAKFYEQFKLNISNIFRDNTKTYNDIVYKNIILKSKIEEFTEVLSESRVKDLLLQ